jgi:4-amino-4-deoxy-L-arabinose transferase-like glycosyltransferase
LGIVLLSGFLNFYQLSQNGLGNEYYAAAVKSMLQSWHNFFFVSFDPGGFVTVDKPPLGLWLQTLSAKIFGFSGLSLLLPSALAGILAVIILYVLVRNAFGPLAGLIAALTLALTPISVVINRSNELDGLLVLTMLLAAWAVLRATKNGDVRWLTLGAFFVGLGFNIKMLDAYLIVPALGLVYLLGAPHSWKTRVWHLAVAVVVLLIVSLSWITIVDLTPASQRPYVGSSSNNSEYNLTFVYNGWDRLTGGAISASTTSTGSSTSSTSSTNPLGNETGSAGVFRLFNQQLGGQISWLLILAVLGLVAAAWRFRRWFPLNYQQQSLVLWGVWLLTMAVFFSIAGFFHVYYLTILAPAICALCGIGIIALWQDYLRPGWRCLLLPIALAATAGVQAHLLSPFPAESSWITPIVLSICLLMALILTIARLKFAHFPHLPTRFRAQLLCLGLLALLLAPTVWITFPMQQAPQGAVPSAGPKTTSGSLGKMSSFGTSADPQLEQYLLLNQGSTTYLFATSSALTAEPYIIDTGKPVMALGGFVGSDPILTTQQLATLVAQGTVRFFLVQSSGGSFDRSGDLPADFSDFPSGGSNPYGGSGNTTFAGISGQNGQLTTWIKAHCQVVPPSAWGSSATSSASSTLYDCARM